jgi:hypothetical protein
MISKLLQICLFLFVLLFQEHAYAESSLFFDQYMYGAPKNTFENLPHISEGEGAFLGDLLVQKVMYNGLEWEGVLSFTDDTLTSLTLFAPYSRERLNIVTASLKASGYELLGIVINEKAFDFLAHLKTTDPATFKEHILSQIRGTKFSRISYAWFAVSDVSKELKQRVANIGELLKTVDPHTQEIEVILLGEEQNSTPQIISLTFSFPALAFMATQK